MDIGILVPERTEAVAEDRQYLIGFRKDRRVAGRVKTKRLRFAEPLFSLLRRDLP